MSAREFWDGLSDSDRWEIGDHLVLGTIDWVEWLGQPAPKGFARAVDQGRTRWKMGR